MNNNSKYYEHKYQKYKLKYLSLKGGEKIEIGDEFEWYTYSPFRKNSYFGRKPEIDVPYIISDPVDYLMISLRTPNFDDVVRFFYRGYEDLVNIQNFEIATRKFLKQYGITWRTNPLKVFVNNNANPQNTKGLYHFIREITDKTSGEEKISEEEKISGEEKISNPDFFSINKLKRASIDEINKFNSFFKDKSILFNSDYKLSQARIPKDLTPLYIDYMYFEIIDSRFYVYALCYGDNTNDNIKNAIIYKNKLLNDNSSKFDFKKEENDNTIRKINLPGDKFFLIGELYGVIDGTNIFIDRFDAGHTPRGGGNHMLCLFINYLKNYNSAYTPDTNFNIELQAVTYTDEAYRNMGFDNINLSNPAYFKVKQPNKKINIDKFINNCQNKFADYKEIKFFEKLG